LTDRPIESRETKICDFDARQVLGLEQDILQFQVTVADVLIVSISNSAHDLRGGNWVGYDSQGGEEGKVNGVTWLKTCRASSSGSAYWKALILSLEALTASNWRSKR
jgi:hypothetical protein